MRILFCMLVLAVFIVPATANAWVCSLLGEDSLSIDTFYVSGDADVDTSVSMIYPSYDKTDLSFMVCMDSDSIECVVMVDQRIWPDTTYLAYTWNVVDSIVFTGLSAIGCSLWVPTLVVPPKETRLRVLGRANNKVSTGGARGGTEVIITQMREERSAD